MECVIKYMIHWKVKNIPVFATDTQVSSNFTKIQGSFRDHCMIIVSTEGQTKMIQRLVHVHSSNERSWKRRTCKDTEIHYCQAWAAPAFRCVCRALTQRWPSLFRHISTWASPSVLVCKWMCGSKVHDFQSFQKWNVLETTKKIYKCKQQKERHQKTMICYNTAHWRPPA